ncbi:DNA-processing protein DprA [Brevundimonas sp.]|uniref:DNA-processing protein DprA n=1 Tax=Brevundimonas sp. TaxID=1871086 RepID=UPI0035B2ABB4
MSTATARRGYDRRPALAASETTLTSVLANTGRPPLADKQSSFLTDDKAPSDVRLFYSGEIKVLARPSVAIVGARAVSDAGILRARRLSRELAEGGLTIVSGLAKGVDTTAHTAAIEAGGRTAAVIGTPLSKAYPAENRELQDEIARHHLLISQFEEGSRVFPANFPKRNRVMAAVSDGTVIIEASDSSGTLHQAAECQRLGRWLFILQSVFEDARLTWPRSFAGYERTKVVRSTEDILGSLQL